MVNEINRRKLDLGSNSKLTSDDKTQLLKEKILTAILAKLKNKKDSNDKEIKQLINKEIQKLVEANNYNDLLDKKNIKTIFRKKCYSDKAMMKKFLNNNKFLRLIGDENLSKLLGSTYDTYFKNDLFIDVYQSFQDSQLVDPNKIKNIDLETEKILLIFSFIKDVRNKLYAKKYIKNCEQLLYDLDDFLVDCLGDTDNDYDNIIEVYKYK